MLDFLANSINTICFLFELKIEYFINLFKVFPILGVRLVVTLIIRFAKMHKHRL